MGPTAVHAAEAARTTVETAAPSSGKEVVVNKLGRSVTAGGLFLLGALLLPALTAGQQLPTPADFVRNLDVRCYRLPALPALGVNLRLDHLNPALVSMGIPPELNVPIGQPQDLCVPVYKNNSPPPATVLPFIQFVDWKCYGITGPSLNLTLNLNQLNPVIAGLFGPTLGVIVREPQQLCVPVRKNNSVPPAAVAQLINWLDVKCYRVESSQIPNGQVTLTHLNPLINKPPELVTFANQPPLQLCVPVKKNLTAPPANVLPIVQYSDVLCYRINGVALNQTFNLTHLNPVLTAMGLPPENNVNVAGSDKLCVPVAKNGFFPPTAASANP